MGKPLQATPRAITAALAPPPTHSAPPAPPLTRPHAGIKAFLEGAPGAKPPPPGQLAELAGDERMLKVGSETLRSCRRLPLSRQRAGCGAPLPCRSQLASRGASLTARHPPPFLCTSTCRSSAPSSPRPEASPPQTCLPACRSCLACAPRCAGPRRRPCACGGGGACVRVPPGRQVTPPSHPITHPLAHPPTHVVYPPAHLPTNVGSAAWSWPRLMCWWCPPPPTPTRCRRFG